MRNAKKLLALMLAALMVFGMVPVSLHDASGMADGRLNILHTQLTEAALEIRFLLVFLYAFELSRESTVDVSEVTIHIDQFCVAALLCRITPRFRKH